MPITSRSTLGRVRPAIDQVAEEDRGAARRVLAPHSVDLVAERREQRRRSSSKQPWTSPMMSNGPCSSRRSFHSGWRVDLDGLDLLGGLAGRRRAEALALQTAQRALAAASAGGGSTCGPKSRSGRAALRSWQTSLRQVEHDRDRQNRSCSRRARPAACAPRGWTLVASTTVSRPRASRLPGDEVQHLEGVRRSRSGRSRRRRPGRGRSPTRAPRSA